MKKDVICTNYDGTENPNGSWWKWKEYCDRCGAVISDYSWMSSVEPDMDELDCCVSCLRELMSLGIPYEDAKAKYKK